MATQQSRWIVVLLSVVIGALGVVIGQNALEAEPKALAQSSGAGQAEPTAVAVVDVEKVFNNVKERQDLQADLKGRAKKLRQQGQKKQKNIQQMRSQLEVLKKGTENYKQQRQKLERALVDFRAWQQFKQQKLERTRGVQMQNLYRKLANTAGEVAQDNGYDVVLYEEGEVDFNFRNSKQLSNMIQMRKVLWASDRLDITDQVQQRMNNKFGAGQ